MATHVPHLPLHRYCIIPQCVQRRIARHPLCRSLFMTEIGYEGDTTFLPFTKNKLTSHYLIIYVVQGEGWYRVRGKTYPVGEHDFFVLPVSLAKTMGSSEEAPWSIYWAYFSGTQAANMTQHLMGGKYAPRKAKPLVGRVAQFNDILHHLELMENIENLAYANGRFYTFLCSFRLMILSSRKHAKKDTV